MSNKSFCVGKTKMTHAHFVKFNPAINHKQNHCSLKSSINNNFIPTPLILMAPMQMYILYNIISFYRKLKSPLSPSEFTLNPKSNPINLIHKKYSFQSFHNQLEENISKTYDSFSYAFISTRVDLIKIKLKNERKMKNFSLELEDIYIQIEENVDVHRDLEEYCFEKYGYECIYKKIIPNHEHKELKLLDILKESNIFNIDNASTSIITMSVRSSVQ